MHPVIAKKRGIKMSVMALDKCRDLFKDEVAYKRFVEQLRSKAHGSGAVILDDNEVIGGVVSSEQLRADLYDRILHRLAGRPEILDELLSRSSEGIVDIDGNSVQ